MQADNTDKEIDRTNFWDKRWSRDYRGAQKREYLEGLFNELTQGDDKLGLIIADIGSGAYPVTGNLDSRKVIEIDIASSENRKGENGKLQIELDIEELPQESEKARRAIQKIYGFLEIDPEESEPIECLDTIILSDVLNYVDYKKVLTSLRRLLKNGGRMIIYYEPDKGFEKVFSSKRPNNNDELKEFLMENGWEIERWEYPIREEHIPPELETVMVIAKKV